MSPSLTPNQPGQRYKIVLAKLGPDGDIVDYIDFEGDTYVVAVANDTATRLSIDLDFAGDPTTCLQLLGHLAEHIGDLSAR